MSIPELKFDKETNLFVSSPIFSKTSKDKIQKSIYYLAYVPKKFASLEYESNWDLNKLDRIVIPNDFLNKKLSEDNVVAYWCETSFIGGKNTRRSPTFVLGGKNIGKKNETNVITQALSEIKSSIDKKIKNGYKSNMEDLDKVGATNNLEQKYESKKIAPVGTPYPLLIHKWEDKKKHIKFSPYALVQPKLDGLRVLIDSDGNCISRGMTLYNQENFTKIIKNLPNKMDKNWVLDGEFYSHDLTLQEINSIVRSGKNDDRLQFWAFDLIVKNKPDMKYADRLDLLKNFIKSLPKEAKKYFELTPTFMVKTEDEYSELHKKFISEGYEGSVIKNNDFLYVYANKKHRSSYALKRKDFIDKEFKLVDIKPGEKGAEKDMAIFTFKLGKKTFDVRPVGTEFGGDEKRKEILKLFKENPKKWIGKEITLRFIGYSDDDVPLYITNMISRNKNE